MFVTLRYGNGKGDEIQCIESTTKPPHEEQANPHLACNMCRSKKVRGVRRTWCEWLTGFKLKCNGEKTGCQRCVSAGFECSYKNERLTERKRKHHLLSNISEARAAQAPRSPHQSKLQVLPGKEKPARRALSSQQMSPELDAMVAGGLEEQNTISPVQAENYSNARSRPDSINQVENISGNFVPTTPASLQRPTSAAVPMTDADHTGLDKELFDQYFTTLEQADDMFSCALQRHSAVPLIEDGGATIDISNSSRRSTHFT
jgi:hypothetical protein